ncbi:MAG: hypothetical protein C0510_00505 [Erythrobacter sp.]|nr:hypothetical protein [Erythrobacter sp.]
MKDIIVPLIRRFVPAKPHFGEWEFLHPEPGGTVQGWRALEEQYRVLVLADAGAGKTFEAKDRAAKLRADGANAFFIRIEAIDAAFENGFEVGTAADFAEWLAGDGEAYFFLDSVDEAQLGTPRALEDAIRLFGARIQTARERARIIITSREDAWQALTDRTLVEQYLPHGAPAEADEKKKKNSDETESDPVLKIYRLGGLKPDQIRLFAAHYGVDANAFMAAVERGGLTTLAERPFDLKALILVWQADGALGSRLKVLQRLIELQLAPLSGMVAPQKISADRARCGAQALAAAVTLTGRSIVSLPDDANKVDRVDPAAVLPDWSEPELVALLRTGIFDDIVYASVRFRHREIRELLTAEWAQRLLVRPGARPEVEGLFFRNQYGEEVIVPRLRPTLCWLLLLDEGVRDRALALEPDIASEGGDPSQLPLAVRREMLAGIVAQIAADAK